MSPTDDTTPDATINALKEDRLYCNYQELLRWIPSLKSDIAASSEDYEVKNLMKYLNKGADSACGDDAAGLKTAVVGWLMRRRPAPEPALESGQKTGHGFYHDVTARLICPVDYDWSNLHHRANIRNFHPEYLVTADCWPRFLYKNEKYDPSNPTKGLFENKMLIQAFRHIFTSPSSANSVDVVDDTDQEDQTPMEPPPKCQRDSSEKRSRAHVAALIGMKSVSPRAIAYTAVQLHFALSSCNAWHIIDEDFDYEKFYHNITTFFEDIRTTQDKAAISKLLLWWNHSVFDRVNVSEYCPQAIEKMSVAITLRRGRDGLATDNSSTV
ncbi:hypothetical protein SCLCIDRAFT_31116 [Scleroderma citrinum Foug A]|uniref:Uncharacterized protein n=1 Tax=Scleroderma citrinum Foug A TaxID=1036808 RepID=A0A0C3DEA8_9AGAM|nr:hypothetical protein SCLCIDRAFT_31116 [Scleroderma citrinum Foug A]